MARVRAAGAFHVRGIGRHQREVVVLVGSGSSASAVTMAIGRFAGSEQRTRELIAKF